MFFALLCSACAATGKTGPAGPRTVAVLIGEDLFHLELAVTPEALDRGLMDRPEIAPDRGMLFIFPDQDVRTFWMKRTLVDLDIIFLDAEGRVTAMHEMRAEPPRGPGESEWAYYRRLPRYSSRTPAKFAIELKGGTLGILGLVVGDRVFLDPAVVGAKP